MSLEAIQLVSVPVSDQAAAKRFYVEVLGFEVVRDSPFTPDARWIELAPAPGAAIALVTWFASAPTGSLQGSLRRPLRMDHVVGDVDAGATAAPPAGARRDAPRPARPRRRSPH